MNLTPEDEQPLAILCTQHDVSYEKVVKLLQTVREHELTDRCTGIYDVLCEIAKAEHCD